MTKTTEADAFLLRGIHHLELERRAVRALEGGDPLLAFRMADRRCRIPPLPASQVYLLRADALNQLGHAKEALNDVARALELTPDEVGATRRMMSWGAGAQRIEAAIAVAAHDHDPVYLKAALTLLRDDGQDAFARIQPFDGEVIGWVSWGTPGEICVKLFSAGETKSLTLTPDRSHPLAVQNGYAASYKIIRPQSAELQSLRITKDQTIVATQQLPRNAPLARSKAAARARVHSPADTARLPDVTIIVPVYADFDATKACLDSLVVALSADKGMRILVVDDASHDPRIKKYLETIASVADVTLISNQTNLGFVGAVNQALRVTKEGDVVLLNADTLMPVDALARLRTIVTASPDIGTATPLSNNGEFTSFPIANRPNPLLPLGAIEQLDTYAAAVSGETAIDIPNGIGFCLYITRRCLDAVGELSDIFYRGYFEDVDLCLRAAEAGFRNVCIPGVYIGHEGSRSFRQEKRSLVVRNLRVLEQRYPRYKAECAAFAMADPIRESRARIEQAILADRRPAELRIILSGDGAIRDIAVERARQLCDRHINALLAVLHLDGQHTWVDVVDPAGGIPQSIRFDLADKEGREQMQRFLVELEPRSLEIAEPTRLSHELVTFLCALCFPYKLLITDGSLATNASLKMGLRPEWQSFVEGADEIVVMHPEASCFAKEVLGLEVSEELVKSLQRRKLRKARANTNCLGIVVARASADEFQFVHDLGIHLAAMRPDARMVVMGCTLDDLRLMHGSNLFVSGPIKSEDIRLLIDGYGIGKLLVGLGGPLFGHPLFAAAETAGLPVAQFSWTESPPTRKADLRIASGIPRRRAFELITRWL